MQLRTLLGKEKAAGTGVPAAFEVVAPQVGLEPASLGFGPLQTTNNWSTCRRIGPNSDINGNTATQPALLHLLTVISAGVSVLVRIPDESFREFSLQNRSQELRSIQTFTIVSPMMDTNRFFPSNPRVFDRVFLSLQTAYNLRLLFP